MTPQQQAAMRQALEALEAYQHNGSVQLFDAAVTALRQAIEQQPTCKHALQVEQQPADEPVATLWQHGETGRTRVTMPGDITDCDASWFKAADLYTRRLPAAPAMFGGGLVAIKTLLSRDPCAHAKVAIEMIDAMLAAAPEQKGN